jgi:hypothetical protein
MGWTGMSKTGPNDASGIVWALSGTTGRSRAGGNGPNDASGVVWALSEFFFLFSVFSILTDLLLLGIIYPLKPAGNDQNSPKRRVRRRLGQR